jgi:2-polyprenyl-3-methyl-5-hydroxy-6-metoxy-1,4-benzoquinol methylase
MMMNRHDSIDYRTQYDDYWSKPDRIGEFSSDPSKTASQVLMTCGLGNTLDTGCGEGFLVSALLRHGVDAHGVDVSEVVVARCIQRMPGRFTRGSVLSLPFGDGAFHTVVSTDCLEHLAPSDVPDALKEICRVAGRYAFLRIATTQDRDEHWHLTVEGRAWWEARCLEAGFRKHPSYYRINAYESLNQDDWQISILLEKIPFDAVARFPLAALEEERGLHMDMLRDVGVRSDAHVVRYQLACNYVKPGDRVLDAACGLGYGGHVLRKLTQAAMVTGIDGSESAIDYAGTCFADEDGRGEFRCGTLPEVLAEFPDGSFEVVVCFETLEHVADPVALIGEFFRVLSPGGRLIASVPNDWSDESGEDPNPYHLHVYNWSRLRSEFSESFILENAFAQTASQCKVASKGNVWEARQRSLKEVKLDGASQEDCEWWILVGMKSPLSGKQEYMERVFLNIADSMHESIRYRENYANPWLLHSMVNAGYRLKNAEALEQLSQEVLVSAPQKSNDYLAALCVKAYRILESAFDRSGEATALLDSINDALQRIDTSPSRLRWKVSLLFAMASLQQSLGRMSDAKLSYIRCAESDVRGFGIHLATKATEAWYAAGKIAYALGAPEEARSLWRNGVRYGEILLDVSLNDILVNPEFPNRFDHGDGVREYALAWDSLAKCANGLHLMARTRSIDFTSLEASFANNISRARENFKAQIILASTFQDALVERTRLLQRAGQDLRDRTKELVDTRELVRDRTLRLEATVGVLAQKENALREALALATNPDEYAREATTRIAAMTSEIDRLKATHNNQFTQIQGLAEDLKQRTDELVGLRAELADRSIRLERSASTLKTRTDELVVTRDDLRERTERLEASVKRIQELEDHLKGFQTAPQLDADTGKSTAPVKKTRKKKAEK